VATQPSPAHADISQSAAWLQELVLEAVEATEGWATSVRASRPPMTIMGSLGGIEAGLRQMRRARPLETIIDDYYDDRSHDEGSVLTSLVLALADPAPRDVHVTKELPRYKGLAAQWHDWQAVVTVCHELSLRLAGAVR
jgi:hypothetical protein